MSSKLAKTPSTGKLDANIHLWYPKILIASRIILLLSLTVHCLPGTQMPDILIAVLGCSAKFTKLAFQLLRPSFDLSAGRPVWFKIIIVSGKSFANFVASSKCHQGVWRSKWSLYFLSKEYPFLKNGSLRVPFELNVLIFGDSEDFGLCLILLIKGNCVWPFKTN